MKFFTCPFYQKDRRVHTAFKPEVDSLSVIIIFHCNVTGDLMTNGHAWIWSQTVLESRISSEATLRGWWENEENRRINQRR